MPSCRVRFFAGALLVAAAAGAQSQAWPSRPVRIIVPYGVGSGVDVIVRLLAEPLAKNLGQPVIAENRPGAAGAIAASTVLQQPPDGHTLLSDTSAHTISPAMNASLPFDTARDFIGVSTLIDLPIVLVTGASRGFKTLPDILAAARVAPGKLTFASAGVGTSSHLSAEKLRLAAGIDLLHVPFKSTTDAMVEVMAGRIDMIYTGLPTALSGIRDGRLVAQALVSRRVAVLPGTPAIAELVPGAGLDSWVGIMASAKAPREIVERLNAEIARAMNSDDMRERLAKLGSEPWVQTVQAFDAMRRREIGEYERLAKAAGLRQ